MSHLHDFMRVTGPRKILTFVTGPFLEIIEKPCPRGLLSKKICIMFDDNHRQNDECQYGLMPIL